MWVRGLKLPTGDDDIAEVWVAPYVGAWIETARKKAERRAEQVAPYVGAWIETSARSARSTDGHVAPYVGAWIETALPAGGSLCYIGRTLCGCVD